MQTEQNRRILIVDDNRAIHDDFRKILAAQTSDASLATLEAELFGEAPVAVGAAVGFDLVSAMQGQEAYGIVEAERAAGRRFALAFVDMRMPPGWDGLETIERLWQLDPELQVVICSAYSDYSWTEVRARLGERDGLLIIKKPFDPIEVSQASHALAAKWELARLARLHVEGLEARIRMRTAALEEANAQLAAQMRELAQMESELRLAQKLESVGRLAAGIAHEINTPIQFASDMAVFLRDAMGGLVGATRNHGAVSRMIVDGAGVTQAAAAARAAIDADGELDLAYLVENVAPAADSVLEGLHRVATIVRAMKTFAHPGRQEMTAIDLNAAIESTLEIARSEYKYVAELRVDLGPLPRVTCRIGEINQAVLNLVINAAHAIRDGVRDSDRKGTIAVSTRVDGESVCIAVADNGTGIPETVRDKIFDPFFTTKEVGTGTGQGLTLARSAIAGHGGTLTFDTEIGRGTTFEIRLPISAVAASTEGGKAA